MKVSDSLANSSTTELQPEISPDEFSELRSDVGKIARLSIATSPLSSIQARVALQRNHQGKILPLFVLADTRKRLQFIHSNEWTKLVNVPLDLDTIYIRCYSDGSCQKLAEKLSQIGFMVGLADEYDSFNTGHWKSSRTTRRTHSTEESELMAA